MNIFYRKKYKKLKKRKHSKKERRRKKALGINLIIIPLTIIIVISLIILILLKKFSKKTLKVYFIDIKNKEIIDNYLLSVPSKYDKEKKDEKEKLERMSSLQILSKDSNTQSVIEAKSQLYNKFINLKKNNSSKEINLYVWGCGNFGNLLVTLNNLIYYSEIFNFKNIYLNPHDFWFLKNNIISDKINITLLPSSQINCNSNDFICFSISLDITPFVYQQFGIKTEVRLNILRDEIKRNLPITNISKNDLIMHFRTGDIFTGFQGSPYSQPPFCFYEKIINNFKFNNIYIIAQDNNTPVIKKLLRDYPNIIYKKNDLKIDISYLIYAYNIVASVSSFFISSVKFNTNLKYYWEYDIYRYSEKFLHLHHDFYYFPRSYTTYKMKPSEYYKNEMFAFYNNQQSLLDLMIKEKCINDFIIIKPNTN